MPTQLMQTIFNFFFRLKTLFLLKRKYKLVYIALHYAELAYNYSNTFYITRLPLICKQIKTTLQTDVLIDFVVLEKNVIKPLI